MGQSQQTTVHPDENLLTAFAERTLGPGERERVLAHLSGCSDCRDAVFLAQQAVPEPELQPGLKMGQSESGAPLWRWAMFSGASLLAAALIVAPLLLHRHAGNSPKLSPKQMAAQTEVGPAIPSAPSPAKSNATGVTRSQVTTALKPTFHPRSSIRSASAAASASAPSEAGSQIAGSVIDAAGAAIPGATVSLRLPDANTRQAVTDSIGRFEIGAIPPGKYVVEFNAPGFKAAARDVNVPVQDRAALSETLAVGASSETVSVSAAPAATPLLTENSAIHGTVAGRGTSSAGLNSRDSTQLLQLAPGAPATTLLIKDGIVQSCVGRVCTARVLPSRAQAVSVAFDATAALVVDANGNLFSTSDAGAHWAGLKPQWQGKAIALRLAPPPSGSGNGPIAGSPVFELTNDQRQIWLSSDEGQTWHPK